MYIFNSFYLLHSYNPSFLICLCFNMVSFRGQKKLGPHPDLSPTFRGLIQNFWRASPPLHMGSPPGQLIVHAIFEILLEISEQFKP